MNKIKVKPDDFGICRLRHYPTGNGKRTQKYALKSVYKIGSKFVVYNDICDTMLEVIDKNFLMQKKYTT